jgi:hypothetical protein
MKPKRKNLTRWMENRLRRLDYKIDTQSAWRLGRRVALSEEELNRCRDRAHRLACDLQIAWGKREREKLLP